jgi:hypothetical protein
MRIEEAIMNWTNEKDSFEAGRAETTKAIEGADEAALLTKWVEAQAEWAKYPHTSPAMCDERAKALGAIDVLKKALNAKGIIDPDRQIEWLSRQPPQS